jgi:2',3'-cyclic-nucleotide 2'-phosphodiesterase
LDEKKYKIMLRSPCMQILFIGDIVGKPGRKAVNRFLRELNESQNLDLVIANGENAAGGAGITEKVYAEIITSGVDVVTSGNHIWDQKDIYNYIDRVERLIRPANYPAETTPGRGSVIVETGRGFKVAVLNLIGRVFMKPAECPFRSAEAIIADLKSMTDIIIVDFHAEATSEKQALGWHLDGQVSAVLGTHSHVQTADNRILPKNTAYISDVGMTGLYDSILGVDREGPIQRFLTQMPHRLTISSGKTLLNAVMLDINESNGDAVSIERIFQIIE